MDQIVHIDSDTSMDFSIENVYFNNSIHKKNMFGRNSNLDSKTELSNGNNISARTFVSNEQAISPFYLKSSRQVDGSVAVKLVLVAALDRETQAVHKVELQALDGGSTPRTGTLLIEVIVTDVNDNRPVFSQV